MSALQSWINRILSVVWSIVGKMDSTNIAIPVQAAQVALYVFQVWVADILMVSG